MPQAPPARAVHAKSDRELALEAEALAVLFNSGTLVHFRDRRRTHVLLANPSWRTVAPGNSPGEHSVHISGATAVGASGRV